MPTGFIPAFTDWDSGLKIPPHSAKLDNSSPIDEWSNAKPHVRESYGTTQCVEASVFSHRGFFFARS